MSPFPAGTVTYDAFLSDPGRYDVYLFDVAVQDSTGAARTLRWSSEPFASGPSDSPASTIWEPRVLSGGIDYESASFDPNAPQWGSLAPAQPSPLIVLQRGGDLDAIRSYRWASATVTVRHGGYTAGGRVPLADFEIIGRYDVPDVPVFEAGRVTFPLRSLDIRLEDAVEARTCYGLGACMGSVAGGGSINFSPFAPGIARRGTVTGSRSASAGTAVVISRPESATVGDLLVAWIGSHSSGGSPYVDWEINSAPSGWVQQVAAETPGSDPRVHRMYCYTKVVGASEPLTYSFGGTGTGCNRAWCVTAYYGQDGTTPVVSPASNTGTTLGTTVTAPSVTTTTAYSVVEWGWAARSGFAVTDPSGTSRIANVSKNGSTGNNVVIRVVAQTIGSAGATGTRAWSGLSPSSLFAAGGIVISNRAAGGDPTKLILTNSLTAHWAMVPYDIGAVGDSHLFGWTGSTAVPFRVLLDASSSCIRVEWTKGSTPASHEFTGIVLESMRRYHCDLWIADTYVRLRVYDWTTEEIQEETITGTGFNGRDSSPDGDYIMLADYCGQLWRTVIWSGIRADSLLDDIRSRPMTGTELLNSALIHCVTFSERGGTIVRDRAPDPAAGLSSGDEVWLPTLTGGPDVQGQEVPNVWGGPVRRCPGILVDSAVDGPHWLAHPTAVLEVLEITEGGAPRQISGEYDDSTLTAYHDFLLDKPAMGTFTVFRGAIGTFYRCLSLPSLLISATIDGEVDGSGDMPATAADLAYHVLTTRGEQPLTPTTEIDDAAFAALAASAPGRVGTMTIPGESLGDLVRRILTTVGAYCFVDRSGVLTVSRWVDPSDIAGDPVESYHRHVIQEGTLKALDVAQPVYQILMRCNRNWQPLQRDQISGDVGTAPGTIFGLMAEWSTIRQRRDSVAAIFPRGRELDTESCFVGPDAATNCAAEAARMLDIQDSVGQAFELTARSLAQRVQLGDLVSLHVTDLGDRNEARDRLGTTSASEWVVTYVRSDRENGSETVRVFRPRLED